MQTLLVLSLESALASTLQSELPEISVISLTPQKAKEAGIPPCALIIADDDAGTLTTTGTSLQAPVIRATRPIRLSDLVAEIRKRLLKSSGKQEFTLKAGYALNASERLLRGPNTQAISLTEKENELLVFLLENRSEAVPRDALLKQVWGYSDDIATHTLETHIYRLRGKIKQLSDDFDIEASPEGGYQLKS